MIIDRKELEGLTNIGEGACGNVYKYKDGIVLKIFNKDGMGLYKDERFSTIVGIEDDLCIFPKEKIIIDGKIQGYVMQYVDGFMLKDLIDQIDLKTLIAAIQKAENDIKMVSSKKIKFYDVNQGGLMWTKDGNFKVIDTDFFYKDEDSTEEEVYNHNLSYFNTSVLSVANFLYCHLVFDYLMTKEKFENLESQFEVLSFMNSETHIVEMFNTAIEIFKNDFGIDVNSLEEMENILKEKKLEKQKEKEEDTTGDKTPIVDKKSNEKEISDEQLKNLNNCIQENINNMTQETDCELLSEISSMFLNGFRIPNWHWSEVSKKTTLDGTKEIALQFFKELDQELYEKIQGIINGNSEFSFKMYMLNENEDFSKTDNDGMPIYTKIPSVISNNGKKCVYIPCKGTIEDIYKLVHELSHTLDYVEPDNPTRNLLGEITPYCFEAMLSNYLVEKGIASKKDVLNIEKKSTKGNYDYIEEVFAVLELMKLKEKKGAIGFEDIIELKERYKLGDRKIADMIGRMENSKPSIDYKARYMIAQLVYPYFMEQYNKNPQTAMNNLKEYFEQIKSNNFIESIKTLGINPQNECIKELIETVNNRFDKLEKSQFNIKEIGKNTINTSIKMKDEAQEQERFIENIIEGMPERLTELEKARYIYIQVGKYYSYNEQYFIANREEQKEMFNKDIDNIRKEKVICSEISKIYAFMLNRIGIDSKVIVREEEDREHAYTEFEIDEKKYKADLLIGELKNIKKGFKTHLFTYSDNKPLEELKRIDDKIGYTYNGMYMNEFISMLKEEMELLDDVDNPECQKLRKDLGIEDLKGKDLLKYKIDFIAKNICNTKLYCSEKSGYFREVVWKCLDVFNNPYIEMPENVNCVNEDSKFETFWVLMDKDDKSKTIYNINNLGEINKVSQESVKKRFNNGMRTLSKSREEELKKILLEDETHRGNIHENDE